VYAAANQRRSGSLSLAWTGQADLDLHCWITRESRVVGHVCYRETAIDWPDATIQLVVDVGKPGVETIAWRTASDLGLEFAVHACDPPMAVSSVAGLCMDARIDDQVLFFEPPAGGEGPWWRLFVIPSGRAPIRVLNDTASRPPYTE
jgi:hypothetical protein